MSEPEYIITRKELTNLILATDMPGDWLKLKGKIVSRPFQSEREKVLEELAIWIKEYQSGRDSAYMEVVLTPVLERIAELRQQQGGRE